MKPGFQLTDWILAPNYLGKGGEAPVEQQAAITAECALVKTIIQSL